MTQEEKDQIIIEMVKERNALRGDRALLEKKMGRARNILHNASATASMLLQGRDDWPDREGYAYPDSTDFQTMLMRYIDIKGRPANLNERVGKRLRYAELIA